jgi:glycosyltransferase involved in cell wall biosynthesis
VPQINTPSLSVLLPNYNYARYIGESLEAIVSQSHVPAEIIVVDDASTDNSVAIIESYARKHPNIKFLRNAQNLGVIASVERCLKQATGDYLSFTSSDDKILPGFYEKSLALLAKYPQAALCCCDSAVWDGQIVSENRNHLSDRPVYFSGREAADLFARDPLAFIRTHTVISKREAVLSVGGYRKELMAQSDSFAFSTIALRYGFCYLPEVLAMFRKHSAGYGQSLISKAGVEQEIIENVFSLLETPEFRDIKPVYKRNAAFSARPWEILKVVATEPKYREYFSLNLLRFALFDKFISRPVLRLFTPKMRVAARWLANQLRSLKLLVRKGRKSDYNGREHDRS